MVRTVYAEVPPRVEYRLGREGERLRPPIAFAETWGKARTATKSKIPQTALDSVRHAANPYSPSFANADDHALRLLRLN